MNLFDHNLRLQDAELAIAALASALRNGGEAGRTALEEAAARLRSQGAVNAARLLAGAGAEAAYRR